MLCASQMHHYQWNCTNTVSLRTSDSLSMRTNVSQFISLGEGWGLVTRHWTLVVQLARTRVNDSLAISATKVKRAKK